MKAVRVGAPGRVEAVETPRPAPDNDEVLVEICWASVCATDRKLARRGADPPRIIGHEAVGLVDEVLVGIHPDVGCGRCPACRAGYENRCPERVSIGLDRDGGLAQWVSVPWDHALPLGDVEPELGPLLEPLACCLHACALLGVRPGETGLVVGAGLMGILCTWALQAMGCTTAVCQRSPERRALARELGADWVLAPTEDPRAVLGDAPAVAVVTAPGAEPLAWALEAVAPGGRVHAFAGTPGGAEVDANLIHYRHLRLVGSTGSTRTDYLRGLDLVAAGGIRLDRLPRTRIGLEEAPAAVLRAPDPRVLKVVIEVKRGCG